MNGDRVGGSKGCKDNGIYNGHNQNGFTQLTPEEAAEFFDDGQLVAFSGFTPAGAAKAVPRALANRATAMHRRGQSMQIRVLTGASTGPSLDDALAEANAISWRAPYQSSRPLRKQINSGELIVGMSFPQFRRDISPMERERHFALCDPGG